MTKKHNWAMKEKQSELFSEFQATGSARAGRPLGRDILLGKKLVFQLSYENIILLFIAFIMLLVICFALGVEKGKNINRAQAAEAKTETLIREIHTAKKTDKVAAAPAEIAPAIGPPEVKKADTPYSIQVIAFKDKKVAEREMARLKKGGYEPFIVSSNEWFQVCIGRYENREEAKEDLKALKKKYPTRYFRRVK